jgi:hypothetical protein
MQTFIDIFQKHSNTNVIIKLESNNPSTFAPYFSCIRDESGREPAQILFEYLYKKENKSEDQEHNTRNYFLFLYLSSLIYDATRMPETNNEHMYIQKSKFKHLKYIITNIFIQESMKEKFLDIFEKTQKTYHGFSKLVKLYKLKKYKSNVKINTDLYLNPIDQNNKNSILINHEDNGYWFSIYDLMNHIETSLINSPFFFSEPLHPKNPYNNIPFSKTTLYNIYFHVSEIRRQFIPTLFHNFFLCEFDLEKLKIENEYLIRDRYIIKQAINIDEERLFSEVRAMLKYVLGNRIIINDDFPKEKLAKIMRPYYYLFLVYRYHISGIEKTNIAKKVLVKKLRELHRYNPNFGRMILKPKITLSTMNKATRQFERTFESGHPTFTMRHAIQMCQMTYEERISRRPIRRPPIVSVQNNHNHNHSTNFILSGARIYTHQIMTPSDTESDSDSDVDDVLIYVNQNTTSIIIDNSQNQIEISEELIRHSIEQLLADNDEFINEFEELQREDYDSES